MNPEWSTVSDTILRPYVRSEINCDIRIVIVTPRPHVSGTLSNGPNLWWQENL